MIKKYKHMREDFSESDFTPEEQEIINSQDDLPDEFFDDALDVEDDIWDDDTYVGEDSDIHKTNIADSDDDLPDDFFDIDDDFDEDDFIDVEDPEYWENSKEIDPNDYDLINNQDAPNNWSELTSKEDLNDDTFTPDEHLEDYKNAIDKSLDPAHSDSFRRIMNLDGMEESKKVMPKNRLKEDDGMKRVALKMEPSYEEYYDLHGEHQKVKDAVTEATGLSDWEILEWTDNSLALVYDDDSSDLTPEIIAIAKNVFKKAWLTESKEVKKNRLKEDSAFLCNNKPKDENRDLPEWVYQRFGKIYESYNK